MKILLVMASIAVALATPINAQATVITVVTEGTLSGRDGIGWFSSPGAYLEAVRYRLQFNYDRDLAGFSWGWEDADVVLGQGGISPVQIFLTIGSRVMDDRYSRSTSIEHEIFDGTPNANLDSIRLSAWVGPRTQDGSFWISQAIYSQNQAFVTQFPQLGNAMTYSVQAGDIATGRFAFYDGTATVQGAEWSEFQTTITSISTSQREGTIPEPGTVALLGIGLFAASRIGRDKAAVGRMHRVAGLR